jgi:hypothetical protein
VGSYLTGRTQRVTLEDYLSESIQCNSGVPQGSHLGYLDINGALDIFENVGVLRYADDLKLFIVHKMHWGLYAVSKGSRQFKRVVPQ